MTRLNTNIRDQIVANALVKSGNTARLKAYGEERSAWAEAVLIDALGDNAELLASLEKKFAALAKQVPKGFATGFGIIKARGTMMLNCAGARVRVYEWDGEKIAPYEHTLLASSPLAERWTALEAELADITDERDKIAQAVRAAIGHPSTVAALLKAWPEAKELLPANLDEAKVQLPAVQVADLNTLVGLPSE